MYQEESESSNGTSRPSSTSGRSICLVDANDQKSYSGTAVSSKHYQYRSCRWFRGKERAGGEERVNIPDIQFITRHEYPCVVEAEILGNFFEAWKYL